MLEIEKTEKRIKRVLPVMASVVAHHGDKYWCIYELLEGELKHRQAKREKLLKHLNDFNSLL